MTVALAALAVLVGLPFLSATVIAEALRLPWWLLAIGFAATEACVLHIQLKREAQTVSISELPLVLGLFFASPLGLLAGRLVGSAAILLFYRRSSGLKTVWTLSSVSLQTAVAVALLHLVSAGNGETSWLTWLGAYAGCIGAKWVSILAVALVMAVYDGGLRPSEVLRDLVTGTRPRRSWSPSGLSRSAAFPRRSRAMAARARQRPGRPARAPRGLIGPRGGGRGTRSVREGGVEPPRPKAPDPKSGVAAVTPLPRARQSRSTSRGCSRLR
jgi:hypothetical protein